MMKPQVFLGIVFLASNVWATPSLSGLPPDDAVQRVLLANPAVQAAASRMRAEEANRSRLESGAYEWYVRVGGQQRRIGPTAIPGERHGEWNTAIERSFRLPGKAAADVQLGQAGVSLAEAAYGDALHETSRGLLKAWFNWLREAATARQWCAQAELLERETNTVERRRQVGDAARLDVVQAEGALAQAQAQRAQAEARRRNAMEELRHRFPGLPLDEPSTLPEPKALTGNENTWLEAIFEHSHELMIARSETHRARLNAERLRQERAPDPTIGLHYGRERSGEESVMGAYLSIALPGNARRANAEAASAEAEAAAAREADRVQRLTAEAVSSYHAAQAGPVAWKATREAAERLEKSAELTARAYQLGEGSLGTLLAARRLANEARLSASLGQLEALEAQYRLLLDAHQLWHVPDEKEAHGD